MTSPCAAVRLRDFYAAVILGKLGFFKSGLFGHDNQYIGEFSIESVYTKTSKQSDSIPGRDTGYGRVQRLHSVGEQDDHAPLQSAPCARPKWV